MWKEIINQWDLLIDWIKQYPKKTAGVGAGFLFALLIVGHIWPKLGMNLQWMETEGEILVDEPKVYTRERLVNDRFTEEAWLNEQLEDIKSANFRTSQAKMSGVNSQHSDVALKAAKSDGNATKSEQPSNTSTQTDTAVLEKAQSDIAPSPTDTFSEMLDYRDKVRNELMRIQLDDRHDIEGNTLYRLNFDAAIIPGANTHATAAIQVTILPSEDPKFTELFRDWKAAMQVMVDNLITDKIGNFFLNPMIKTPGNGDLGAERVEFESFLRNEVCEEVKSLSEKFHPKNTPRNKINCPGSALETWYETLQLQISQMIANITRPSKKFAYYDCDKHENPFFCEVEKLIGSYSMNLIQANTNRAAQSYFMSIIKIHPDLDHNQNNAVKLIKNIASFCGLHPPIPDEPFHRAYYQFQDQDLKIITAKDLNGMPKYDKDKWLEIPCPEVQPPQQSLVVVMSLLEQLQGLSTNTDKKEAELFKSKSDSEFKELADEAFYPRVIEELIRPYNCINDKNKINPHIHIQGSFIYTNFNERQPCSPKEGDHLILHEHLINSIFQNETNIISLGDPKNIAYLMAKYHEKKLAALKDFFSFTLEGCDIQQCRLVLNETPQSVENLIDKLDSVTQTFSYSIAPQMQTQRIALLNKQKNQLQALINISLQGGDTNAEGLIKHFTALEKELEILERNPIVVGFGDWQHEETANEPNQTTSFGWIIKPRLTAASGGLFGSTEFRQVSDHYPLSAVISIPSWWRNVTVQVNKCWLNSPELNNSNSSLCRNQNGSTFNIKIPGKTNDINQKLGIEVIKAPYLPPTNYGENKQTLEVGREAVVRLEGERLWRSTVVMLDNQKADSIEVLPNMQAVLAKFKCLRPSSGQEHMENYIYDSGGLPLPINPDTVAINNSNNVGNPKNNTASTQPSKDSLVQLWTSEGKAHPLPVTLKPFVQRYVGEAPCYVDPTLVKATQELNKTRIGQSTSKNN